MAAESDLGTGGGVVEEMELAGVSLWSMNFFTNMGSTAFKVFDRVRFLSLSSTLRSSGYFI